jgi:hypothetical protein
MNIDIVRHDARARKAEELVQGYVRRQPDAVKLVHELLTAGKSMEAFMAEALAKKLDVIERDRSPNHHRREPPQRQPGGSAVRRARSRISALASGPATSRASVSTSSAKAERFSGRCWPAHFARLALILRSLVKPCFSFS